jgi:thioredoxin 1
MISSGVAHGSILRGDRCEHFIVRMSQPANLIHFKGSTADLASLVRDADGLVVIDFFAEWCGPCQNLGRQLPAIANQYPGVKFVKANVDENKDVAGVYSVRSIPHVIFTKEASDDGKVIALEVINGPNAAAIKAAIEKYM